MTAAFSTYLNHTPRDIEQARVDLIVSDAANAGYGAASLNAWDEIERQEAIKNAAWAIMTAAEAALINLAKRSEEHRSVVNADQADWVQTIADTFADLDSDTFGCLPEAIQRAKREG